MLRGLSPSSPLELVAAAAGLEVFDGKLSHLGPASLHEVAAAGVFDACPGVVVDGRYSCDFDRVGQAFWGIVIE